MSSPVIVTSLPLPKSPRPAAATRVLAQALGGRILGPDGFGAAEGGELLPLRGSHSPAALRREVQWQASQAQRLVVLDPELLPEALSGTARVVACVPPDFPPARLRSLGLAKAPASLHRLVVQSPMHHLFALEALRLPASRVELIPPGIDHRSTVPTPARVEPDLVVVPAFPGMDAGLFQGSLARDGRVEVVCAPGRRADVPTALPPSVSVRELSAEGTSELLARAAVVLLSPAHREAGHGWQEALVAMAAGRPVVAARTWGVEHLLVAEQEAFFFEPGRFGDARNAVRELLGHPELAARLGAAARAKVESTLTLDLWAARVARILGARANAPLPEFFLIAAHGRADSGAA